MKESMVARPYLNALSRVPKGILAGQFRAEVADEAVVFLVGMRINRLLKFWSWLPAFLAMPKMLTQLKRSPHPGFLGARIFWSGRVFMAVQYWRSAEELGAYARDPRFQHVFAWRAFNRVTAGTGDVGAFHETYTVPANGVEALYGNMPGFGLGAAFGLVPRHGGRKTSTMERMKVSEPEYISTER